MSGHQLSLAATVALADALGWRCRGTFLGVGARSFTLGERLSGPVAAALPALTAAIERLRDPELRARLRDGARARREELSWERTKEDLAALVASLDPAAGA